MLKSTVKMLVSMCLILVFVGVLSITMNSQEKTRTTTISIVRIQDCVRNLQSIDERQMPGIRRITEADFQKRAAVMQRIRPSEVIKGDHVAQGIGLRNRGGGKISLRGIPDNPSIIKAYLYWGVIGNSEVDDVNRVSVNGVAVTSKLVGSGSSPCWGLSSNYIYRAEVPNPVLYIGGNGDYEISGVPSSDFRGGDPWAGTMRPGYLAEGATLVIFFANEGKVSYIYDEKISGTMFYSNFSADLEGFNASRSMAKFTMMGADGQTGSGLQANYYVTNEESYFQGTQISGHSDSPSSFQNANSDWNGNDGEPFNQLWDTHSHLVSIRQNSTSANVSYQSYGDCLVIGGFILTI
ncbi:MAG: DUF3344 domain-containing protein [Acidobacteria bacterium]|jgi:hypothetical protein|nr:DUF3344 domain-containing protein [Acidobacteriota bacterium]